MKKIKMLVIVMGIFMGAIAFGKTYEIGISQIVEHPALDRVKQGVEEELKRSGLEYNIEMQVAQGEMITQQLIMQKYVKDKKDLIVAISTPTLQSAINATADIPIVFGAITDAKLAGVTEDKRNVTGRTDKVNPEAMIDLTMKLLPNTKTIGVIYNPSEKNSEVNVKLMDKIASERGLKLIAIGITSTNDLSSALDTVMNKADVLHTITDNLTVAAAPIIMTRAQEKKFPVIAMEGVSQVKIGALAGFEVDYKKTGIEIGKMVVEILKGKKVEELPIVNPKNYPILVNYETSQKIGVVIPNELN